MGIKDGRGDHKVKQGEKTFNRISEWVRNNPGALKKEACEALGITYKTLSTHLKKM